MKRITTAILILTLLGPSYASKRTDDLKKFSKAVKSSRVRLKIDVLKINRSRGLSDIHTTNLYAIDSMVVYRARRIDIEEQDVKGKSFGEALGEGIAQGMFESTDRLIYTDANEMAQAARDLNKKAAGQKLGAGAVVKVRKISYKDKSATVYINSPHGISTRIYFRFDTKKYTAEDMAMLWGLAFESLEPDPLEDMAEKSTTIEGGDTEDEEGDDEGSDTDDEE